MFRKIVLALSATAALGAAILVPTAASAVHPMPPSHKPAGASGGVFPHIDAALWTCRHSASGRSYDCRWVLRGR